MSTEIDQSPLSTLSKRIIFVVALAQGVALTLYYRALNEVWWPFEGDAITATIGLLISWLPLLFVMTFRHTLWSRFYLIWLVGHVVLLVVAGTFWGSLSEANALSITGGARVLAFGVACFLCLVWMRACLHEQRWMPSYSALCAFSSHSFSLLALGTLFGVLVLALCMLVGGLFAVIGIDAISRFFREPEFVIPVWCLSFASAAIWARSSVASNLRSRLALRAAFKFIVPPLALVTILFVAALPFTGVAVIWDEGYGTATLLSFIFVTLFGLNAVLQDGDRVVYQGAVALLVRSLPLALTVLLALCVYGLFERIAQYGLTFDRVVAVLMVAIAACFVVLYAVFVVPKPLSHLTALGRVNRAMSLVVLGVCLSLITPLIAWDKLIISQQLSRLSQDKVLAEQFDYSYLVRLGDRGRAAVESLQTNTQYHQRHRPIDAAQRS